MKKKYIYIFITLLLLLGGYFIINNTYFKAHKIISEQPVDYQLSVDRMMQEFSINESESLSKYLDKIIVLKGNLKTINPPKNNLSIVILEGENGLVNCEFLQTDLEQLIKVSPGEIIQIKGLFIGYDDLLGELQLKKCSILQ